MNIKAIVFGLVFSGMISIQAFAGPVIIDNFEDAQDIRALGGETKTGSVNAALPGVILGNARDALVRNNSAGGAVDLEIDTITNNVKIYGETGADGVLVLTYDGKDLAPGFTDGDAGTLTKDGLGGAMLIDGTNDAIVLEGLDNDSPGSTDISGSVTIYNNSDTSKFATRAFVITDGFSGNGVLEFTTFTFHNSFVLSDFDDVGAIVISFDTNGLEDTDFELDNIVARQSGATGDGSLPTPEPASIIMFLMGFAALCFYGYRRRQQQLVGAAA